MLQLLRTYGANCPRYKELREQDKKSTEYKHLEKENKVFTLLSMYVHNTTSFDTMYIQRFILLLCVYICTYVQEFFKRMEEKTGLIPTKLDSIWTIQDTVLVEVPVYYY